MRGTPAVLLAAALCGCSTLPYGIHDKTAEPGFELMRQGNWDNAIADFTNRINEAPSNFGFYALRAKAQYSRGDFRGAVADWSKAIELSEGSGGEGLWMLRSDRGAAYYSLGRCEEAVADLNKSIAAHDNAADHAVRGACFANQGRCEQALADFDRALAESPSMAMALGGRGDCALALKRYPEAIEALTKYVSMHPDDGRYIFLQGVAFHALGQDDQARAAAQRALVNNEYSEHVFGKGRELEMFDLDGRRALVRESLDAAKAAEAGGKWREAFDALTRAWGRNLALTAQDRADAAAIRDEFFNVYPRLKDKPALPEYARRYLVEAESYAKEVGDPGAPVLALRSYERLAAVAPWYPPAYYQAALLRAKIKDYGFAVHEMKLYMRLVPGAKDLSEAQDRIYEWEARLK